MSDEKKGKSKILLLEDRDNEARAIKKNLESTPNRQWEVQYVKNMKEFTERVEEEYFDIFIIDYDIPEDRGSRRAGGGEKALDVLRNKMGVVPAIIYSGVLKGELEEEEVVKKGASYILRKGRRGSALAALIDRIIDEHDEKIGFRLKSYFSNRLGEKTFYLNLISEDRIENQDDVKTKITVEIQRLFDDKSTIYEVYMNKDGEIVNARKKAA